MNSTTEKRDWGCNLNLRRNRPSHVPDRRAMPRRPYNFGWVNWRNIPITLINADFGDAKAQACVNACLRQLRKPPEDSYNWGAKQTDNDGAVDCRSCSSV